MSASIISDQPGHSCSLQDFSCFMWPLSYSASPELHRALFATACMVAMSKHFLSLVITPCMQTLLLCYLSSNWWTPNLAASCGTRTPSHPLARVVWSTGNTSCTNLALFIICIYICIYVCSCCNECLLLVRALLAVDRGYAQSDSALCPVVVSISIILMLAGLGAGAPWSPWLPCVVSWWR